jgi:probable addiction module antidote protein
MKTYKAGIPYDEWEVQQLKKDREFAIEYLKVALESLDNPEERSISLIMLRALAEAYGGIGAIAAKAGINRESLYRSLSPKGNPTFKTLTAIVNAMGLRLSVIEAPQSKAKRVKSKVSRSKAARKAA